MNIAVFCLEENKFCMDLLEQLDNASHKYTNITAYGITPSQLHDAINKAKKHECEYFITIQSHPISDKINNSQHGIIFLDPDNHQSSVVASKINYAENYMYDFKRTLYTHNDIPNSLYIVYDATKIEDLNPFEEALNIVDSIAECTGSLTKREAIKQEKSIIHYKLICNAISNNPIHGTDLNKLKIMADTVPGAKIYNDDNKKLVYLSSLNKINPMNPSNKRNDNQKEKQNSIITHISKAQTRKSANLTKL